MNSQFLLKVKQFYKWALSTFGIVLIYFLVFFINILVGRNIGFVVQVRLIKNNNMVIFFSNLNISTESIDSCRTKRNIFKD